MIQFALFFLVLSGIRGNQACPDKCSQCMKDTSQKIATCVSCLRSILLNNECHNIDVSFDNCLSIGHQGQCQICEKGYILNFRDWSCIPINVPTAIMATAIDYWRDGKYEIKECEGGSPSLDFRDCVKFEDNQSPLKDCVWARRSKTYGVHCSRCKEGEMYLFNQETGITQCTSEGVIPGCIDGVTGIGCTRCDFWNGWFFGELGTCTQGK